MKKTTLLTTILLTLLALAAALSSCAGKNASETGEDTTLAFLENETEQGTVTPPDHLSATGPSETQDEDTTEKKSETITEKETEKETEKAVETPIESLRFASYGNGTCAVTGIGSCTDLFIVIPERSPDGDIVTSIEDRAFYGNEDIKAVEIPSTVTSIGSMAFGGCSSLVYISVDKSNKSFTDIVGVLYNRDGSELIAYPSACGATTLELSDNVKKIADMAFYGCDGLSVINYKGTLSDWGKIDIGEMNYGLFTASVSCGAGK